MEEIDGRKLKTIKLTHLLSVGERWCCRRMWLRSSSCQEEYEGCWIWQNM